MRPYGIFKRGPDIEDNLVLRYRDLSKADWADVFFDLYRQTINDAASDEEILADAERRAKLLRGHREAAKTAAGPRVEVRPCSVAN